jgi:hypothetical protein
MSLASGHLGPTLERMEHGRGFKEALLMNGKRESSTPYAQPLLDAVSLFEELGVGYALVGGIAAMYFGQPRFTEDVDFVAATGHMEVLAAHPAAMEKHHFDPACTFKLYHHSGLEVDLWKDEHADDIIRRGIEVELAGRTVRLAEPHDLITSAQFAQFLEIKKQADG